MSIIGRRNEPERTGPKRKIGDVRDFIRRELNGGRTAQEPAPALPEQSPEGDTKAAGNSAQFAPPVSDAEAPVAERRVLDLGSASTGEIGRLIGRLEDTRTFLLSESDRVQRQVTDLVQFCDRTQAAVTIIRESVAKLA